MRCRRGSHPIQVLVVPVSDAFRGYAERIVQRFRASFVRAEVAPAGETVARNLRDAIRRRVPNVLVVGAREQTAGTVVLRCLGSSQQWDVPLDECVRRVLDAIAQRRRALDVAGLTSVTT